MSTGSTDLQSMLATLDATLRPGGSVYAVAEQVHPAVLLAQATIWEDEGLTVVLRRADADRPDLLVPEEDRDRASEVIRSVRADDSERS